jgi:hypothetical protein
VRNRSRIVPALARSAGLLAIVLALVSTCATHATAGKIEAIRGKSYPLSAKNGPWMIKVASLFEEAEHQEVPIANELVYQLRKKGIPAYTHRQTEESEEIESVDRQGRLRHKKLTSQRAMIAILAGNYRDQDDKSPHPGTESWEVGQKTVKYIKDKKKFNPEMTIDWNGREVTVPLPISKAFLVKNPLLPPEELAKKTRDPLILKLNSGWDHSLFENKGRYTLVVASFFGKSEVSPAKFQEFNKMFDDRSKVSLDNAAQESWKVMSTLRQLGFDAYVYHDRFKSIVTVGSFKSPNDPDIQRLVQKFRAKEEQDPKTGKPMLLAVNLQIDPRDKKPVLLDDPLHGPGARKPMPGEKSKKIGAKLQPNGPFNGWLMDPVPQLMEVPK